MSNYNTEDQATNIRRRISSLRAQYEETNHNLKTLNIQKKELECHYAKYIKNYKKIAYSKMVTLLAILIVVPVWGVLVVGGLMLISYISDLVFPTFDTDGWINALLSIVATIFFVFFLPIILYAFVDEKLRDFLSRKYKAKYYEYLDKASILNKETKALSKRITEIDNQIKTAQESLHYAEAGIHVFASDVIKRMEADKAKNQSGEYEIELAPVIDVSDV